MAKELLADKIRLDYDPEGDVLYISFGEPQAVRSCCPLHRLQDGTRLTKWQERTKK